MPAQWSRRRYAMASSPLAPGGCSISSTAEAFFLNRSNSLPRSATSIAFDPELAGLIDGGPGRSALIQYIMAESETLAFTKADPAGPWQAFVMRQVVQAVNDGDMTSFVGGLRREQRML